MDILIGLFYSVLILRFIQTVYWYRRGEASIQVLQCMTGIAIAFLLIITKIGRASCRERV